MKQVLGAASAFEKKGGGGAQERIAEWKEGKRGVKLDGMFKKPRFGAKKRGRGRKRGGVAQPIISLSPPSLFHAYKDREKEKGGKITK